MGPEPPTKKRQHQIPQFYLRGFTSPDHEEIWTYDKRTGDVRHSSVENTAYETHLYSVTLDDGRRLTEIEDLIAKIEGVAAPLYEKVLRGEQLEDQERADFASFLALMYARTDANRRLYAELAGHVLQAKMYAYATHDQAFEGLVKRIEADRGPMSEDEREAVRQVGRDPSEFIISIDKDWTLQALGVHDRLLPLFFKMHWMIVEAPTGSYFITSDNPLVRFVPPQCRQGMVWGGFADRNVEASLPLSQGLCWVGHWQDGTPARGRATPRQVRELNTLRAREAERFLYGPKLDSGIVKLAKKYHDVRPAREVRGFGPQRRAEIKVRRSSHRRGK